MSNNKQISFKLTSFLFYIGVVVSFIPILVFWHFFPGKISEEISDWGNWGQYMSGSIGVLLSALTIILVVKSINIQTQEFNAMIENQKESTKLLILQNFENTFFNLMDLHYKVVMNVNGYISETFYSGKDFFLHFVIYSRDDIDPKDFNRHIYDFSEKFSNYRLTVLEVFSFISKYAPAFELERYLSIYKSQISNNELVTLCYMAAKNNDIELKHLINKYSLIELVKIEDQADLPEGVYPTAIKEYILDCKTQ
jgi:hypothetical protein